MLLENDAPRSYGCLMGYPPAQMQEYFSKFAKNAIKPDSLYIDPNDPSYGYEEDPHVTIKYGFTPDLTNANIAEILKGAKPFTVILKSLSLFENEKFDVVKFDVEPTEELLELRRRCDVYHSKDTYPEYHPHVTVAYVKKGAFTQVRDEINIQFPISRIKYSGANGKKVFMNYQPAKAGWFLLQPIAYYC